MSELLHRISPFPGIRNFEPEEDFLFFGRDEQIKNMLGILSEKHFLALIGYSGSGKSSLIKAGIIPAICKGKMDGDSAGQWDTVYFRPGDDPFRAFAQGLYKTFGNDADEEVFITDAIAFLKKPDTDLSRIYQKYNTTTGKKWLVFIDQFEELFRFRSTDYTEAQLKEAQQFIRVMLSVMNNAGSPVYAAITMRSDFIDSCTEFTDLPEALNEVFYLLPKFSAASLREAIVKPIEVCGGAITNTLVERLIDEADDRTEHLPVLQHALMRTWEYWKLNRVGDEPIDHKHYEAIGGMAMALSIHAEEIYKAITSARGKQITETIFKALNEPGADNKGTRRPVPLRDLVSLTQASEEDVVDVIDQFRAQGRAFLLPYYYNTLTPDSVIDIAHESIMRLWQRLKGWIEEETHSAELYLRLCDSARLYQQGQTGLLIDTDLALAVKWQKDNNPNALWASRYDPAFERAITYLEYSKKESVTRIEQKAQKQARELKGAKRTAIILGTAAVISILLLVFALNLKFKADASAEAALKKDENSRRASAEAEAKKKEAELQKRISEQQKEIAGEQQLIAEQQRAQALLDQKEAETQKTKAQASEEVAKKARSRAEALKIEADGSANKAKLSAAEALTQADNANKARRDADTLRMLSEAKAIAFKANQLLGDAQKDELSMQLAFLAYAVNKEYGGPAQNRAVYDALKAQLDRYYTKALTTSYGIANDPGNYDLRTVKFLNDRNFFTAGDDGQLREWKVDPSPLQIANIRTGRTLAESIYDISLSPDKKYLLGRLGGKVAVWNANNITDTARRLNEPAMGAVQYATFLPVQSGNTVLVRNDRYAYIYNFANNRFKLQNRYELPKTTGDNSSPAGCVRPVKDGSIAYLAQGSAISALTFDHTGELTAESIVIELRQKISAMCISTERNILAIGTENGSIELYNIAGSKPVFMTHISSHSARVTGISFAANGGSLVTGSLDNSIKIKDIRTRNTNMEDLIFQERKGWVRNIVLSPDNRHVLSVGRSGVMQFWPLSQLIALQELTGFAANKKTITASVDEKEIETAISSDVYNRLLTDKYKTFKAYWNAMATKYIN